MTGFESLEGIIKIRKLTLSVPRRRVSADDVIQIVTGSQV